MRKEKKFAVHPLFWVFGIYFFLNGQGFVFLLITLAALEHECAHAFSAAKRGFELNKILLMPYGAVVSGEIDGMSLKDELSIALAGPLVSGLTAFFFVALWWIEPNLYPYTDGAAFACLSLAVVNLLPAHPLDGGRIVLCLLRRRLPLKMARRIVRSLTVLISVLGMGGAFHLFLQGQGNVSLLFFSVFLLFGTFESGKYGYGRISFDLKKGFMRGMEEKRVALCANVALAKTIPFLSDGRYLVLELFDEDGEFLCAVRQEDLTAWLQKEDLSKSLKELVKNE